jgi:predicted RecA/RadA family phage recombinase
MKNFIQLGDVLDYTATQAVASGVLVVIGARVGIAVANIPAGETGRACQGVVELAKLGTDTPEQEVLLLYWDAANSRLTTTEGSNVLAGYAAQAAGAGVTTVWLHLNA